MGSYRVFRKASFEFEYQLNIKGMAELVLCVGGCSGEVLLSAQCIRQGHCTSSFNCYVRSQGRVVTARYQTKQNHSFCVQHCKGILPLRHQPYMESCRPQFLGDGLIAVPHQLQASDCSDIASKS